MRTCSILMITQLLFAFPAICDGQQSDTKRFEIHYSAPERGYYDLVLPIKYMFKKCSNQNISVIVALEKSKIKAYTYYYDGTYYNIEELMGTEVKPSIEYVSFIGTYNFPSCGIGNGGCYYNEIVLKLVNDWDIGGCFGSSYKLESECVYRNFPEGKLLCDWNNFWLDYDEITDLNARSSEIELKITQKLKREAEEKEYEKLITEGQNFIFEKNIAAAKQAFQKAARIANGDTRAQEFLDEIETLEKEALRQQVEEQKEAAEAEESAATKTKSSTSSNSEYAYSNPYGSAIVEQQMARTQESYKALDRSLSDLNNTLSNMARDIREGNRLVEEQRKKEAAEKAARKRAYKNEFLKDLDYIEFGCYEDHFIDAYPSTNGSQITYDNRHSVYESHDMKNTFVKTYESGQILEFRLGYSTDWYYENDKITLVQSINYKKYLSGIDLRTGKPFYHEYIKSWKKIPWSAFHDAEGNRIIKVGKKPKVEIIDVSTQKKILSIPIKGRFSSEFYYVDGQLFDEFGQVRMRNYSQVTIYENILDGVFGVNFKSSEVWVRKKLDRYRYMVSIGQNSAGVEKGDYFVNFANGKWINFSTIPRNNAIIDNSVWETCRVSPDKQWVSFLAKIPDSDFAFAFFVNLKEKKLNKLELGGYRETKGIYLSNSMRNYYQIWHHDDKSYSRIFKFPEILGCDDGK